MWIDGHDDPVAIRKDDLVMRCSRLRTRRKFGEPTHVRVLLLFCQSKPKESKADEPKEKEKEKDEKAAAKKADDEDDADLQPHEWSLETFVQLIGSSSVRAFSISAL